MQICPHCGKDNLEGMLYCQKCGVALGPVPLSTRQLADEEGRGGTDELGSDNVVILQIENDETPILLGNIHFKPTVIIEISCTFMRACFPCMVDRPHNDSCGRTRKHITYSLFLKTNTQFLVG